MYYTFIATKNIKEYIIDTCDVMHQNIISQEDTREGDSVTLEEKIFLQYVEDKLLHI